MSDDSKEVVVKFRDDRGEAQERSFSEAVHGEGYKALAAEFSAKMKKRNKLISSEVEEAENTGENLGGTDEKGGASTRTGKAPAKKTPAKKAPAKKAATKTAKRSK